MKEPVDYGRVADALAQLGKHSVRELVKNPELVRPAFESYMGVNGDHDRHTAFLRSAHEHPHREDIQRGLGYLVFGKEAQ